MPEDRTPIRSDNLYVSWQTRKGMIFAALKTPEMTMDGLVDGILWGWLTDNHPEIVKYLQEQQEAENSFREKMRHEKAAKSV